MTAGGGARGWWCFAVFCTVLAACDDTPAGPADGGVGSDGGVDARAELLASCPPSGAEGSFVLAPSGLPAGAMAEADVSAVAPGVPLRRALFGAVTPVPPGPYTLDAPFVAPPAPLVREAYRLDPGASLSFCVRAGQSTQVPLPYVRVASSGKMWVGNSLANAAMLGYAPAALGASGGPAATVAARTVGADGFTFDREGNLWVLGGTTVDPPLARYPAASLGSSGPKTPDVTIDSPSFGGGSPGPQALAFDRRGDLWVSVVFADKVVRFAARDLLTSGKPAAASEIGGIDGPNGLAFDESGNLFVAAAGAGKVMKVDQGQTELASGGRATLGIAAQSPPPVVVNLPGPESLAFDEVGNLWVNFNGTLVALRPDDLLGTGEKTLTPAVQKKLGVTALPHGLAFDEGGGLFVALDKGRFGRIAPAALASSGDVVPEVLIQSPDVGYAGWFAPYPAPAGLPLAHSLP